MTEQIPEDLKKVGYAVSPFAVAAIIVGFAIVAGKGMAQLPGGTPQAVYMNPIEEIFAGPVRDEYGIETYWRISFSNNIWITPGMRLVFNPSLNQERDFIAVPQFKFRVAL